MAFQWKNISEQWGHCLWTPTVTPNALCTIDVRSGLWHLTVLTWNTSPREVITFSPWSETPASPWLWVVLLSLCFLCVLFCDQSFSTSWIHHGAAHYSERGSVCLHYCHNRKAGLQWNICSVPAYLLSEGPFNLNGVLSVMPLVNEWVCEGLRAVQCGKNAIISF